MSKNDRLLTFDNDPRFVLRTSPDGCVEEIRPRVESVFSPAVLIGGIGDNYLRPSETLSEFFDPLVRGDCVIRDHLLHEYHSMRNSRTQPECLRATQEWRDAGDHWEWEMTITQAASPDRELSVELSIPHPIFPGHSGPGHSNWQLWAPASLAPLGNDYGVRKFHHCKCIDEKTDIPLPICSLYHTKGDLSLGLSYLLPPDQTWYVDFEFDQREWLTKITFRNIALIANNPVVLRFWLFSHEGDWRAAMGWLRTKFPVLFAPVPGQEKIEGNMAYTIPMIPEKRISEWASKMRLGWNELFHFRDFGNYFPDEPFDVDHYKTADHPEWTAENLTYDDINRYIDMCHRHGVRVMPYFNIGECESRIAREVFPEAIVKIFNGQELVPWVYYHRKSYSILCNSDPELPFFDYVLEQFQRLMERCPGIDGFFFDQMSYGWIDTAHFDGVTFFNNRPAYNLAHMYLRALKKVREIFPRPRIVGMGNGVVRWQLMEYLDGVMAEGNPESLGRVAMLSPERPTMCLDEGENAMQEALLHGSWLHVSPYYRYPSEEPLPEDALRLFGAYNRFFDCLQGRKWIYEPNALKVEVVSENIYRRPLLNWDQGVRANLFQTGWGDIAIVILGVPKGVAMENTLSLAVTVRLAAAGALRHAVRFGPDGLPPTIQAVHAAATNEITLRFDGHGAATMILLTADLENLRVCAPGVFAR